MPRISIVMPVFNSATYLEESITSILNQTYSDWEFLIINELGSTDGSKEIVEKYAKVDKRFILIQNEAKLGIAQSMNVGLKAAKGEYIARMDADDISLPERFEKQIKYMDENLDIAMCGVKVDIFGTNPFEWSLEYEPDKLTTNILFYSPSVHPTVMIRKSFLDKYGITYNKEYKASEDYDIFSKICERGKVANINETLFKYRIMENNATFKNNDIGLVIYNEVMKRQFARLDLVFTDQELKLLSPHYSMKGAKGREVISRLVQLDLLLKRILVANSKVGIYNQDYLMNTLSKRYKEAYDSIAWSCSNVDFNKASVIYSKSIFIKTKFYHSEIRYEVDLQPQISVLIPTYNSEKYLIDTLWSILEQTYTNFEVLILNEFGSDDDTAYIANMFNDPRIIVIQNKEKLGLAESLNLGIRNARGKYLARMDADDLCVKTRFQLQYEFLEDNKEYGIVGSWQYHFGIDTDWVHKCSISNEDIEAELLYNCDLCHSTLMLRKEYFIENNLFYDNLYAAEDYELWTRAIRKFKIANIPQVLGEYRIGEDNITAQKADALSIESGQLVARNLLWHLDIEVEKEHIRFLSGWRNEYNSIDKSKLNKSLLYEKKLLMQIWRNNKRLNVFNDDSLLRTINKRWRTVTNTWKEDGIVFEINTLFKTIGYGTTKSISEQLPRQKFTLKRFIKKCLSRVYRPIKYRTIDIIQNQLWDMDGHLNDFDGHLYDYKSEIINLINEKFSELEQIQVKCIDERIKNMESTLLSQFNLGLDESLTMLESKVLNNLQQYSNESIKIAKEVERAEAQITNQVDGIREEIKSLKRYDYDNDKVNKSIVEFVDNRIWKSELYLNKQIKSSIWNLQTKLLRNNSDKISKNGNYVYSDYFYEDNQYGSYISAVHVLKFLLGRLKSKSVIDFGCGTGTWLYVAKTTKDVNVIKGLDGNYINRDMLMISRSDFIPTDLENVVDLGETFELAISLEVAEHIEEKYANTFIDSICRHSNIVLFSAAHVGQGGDMHVNEQPLEYWSEKFIKRGYRMIDIRPYFSINYEIEQWYRENMVLYVHQTNYEVIKALFPEA